jgi:ATP/maltotriose-dependent transcriptional regulator MalT
MKQIQELEEQNKIRSVAMLVQLHKRSARQLVLQQKGNRDSTLELIATTLDEGIPSKIWGDLQSEFSSRSSEASDWKSSISNLTTAENDLEKVESSIANLRSIANKFESPLLNIEVLRLNGELNVSGGNTAQAIESLVTAAELAAGQGDSSMAADLWLMSCEASQRMDQVEQARQCWRAALQSQVTSLHARGVSQPLPTIDPVFWEHASRLAHPGDKLPKELTLALAPWYSRMGIRTSESLSPETALWSAIAEYQLVTGQPHLASLSIKRAESQAPETSHPYLQIALARAMAAQGQQTVATTILGSVADSEIPGIRASALAVLGSIKLQAGAYEQGGKFLGEALAVENAEDWPGRLAAQADFANVRLILGKLDDALPALHSVQTEMLKHEKWQSLCHSLENEAAVLEIEGRKKEAREIRQRVAKIESRQL